MPLVLACGDSNVGTQYQPEKLPHALAQALTSQYKVGAVGVSGATACKAVKPLVSRQTFGKALQLQLGQGDYVVVCLGTNDIATGSPKDFRQGLVETINTLLSSFSGSPSVLVLPPLHANAPAEFVEAAMQAVADSSGHRAAFVPVDLEFTWVFRQGDPKHLTAAGAKHVAEALAKFILRRSRGSNFSVDELLQLQHGQKKRKRLSAKKELPNITSDLRSLCPDAAGQLDNLAKVIDMRSREPANDDAKQRKQRERTLHNLREEYHDSHEDAVLRTRVAEEARYTQVREIMSTLSPLAARRKAPRESPDDDLAATKKKKFKKQ
eukprot:TRINITY_DN64150_c0_g1_i1.p1 TRINITY_DN64150_c0_g1~~TRINITY_DN64150_c0_g1_i1.p1  ORF type:complete len:339 (-),score=40.55 TRINITY_DN64150_c0_g1_i1:347-1315(-)